jgi:hypothetical protein
VNRLEEALYRIRGELERLGARWALIGGIAVSVRAEPRTTRDIDVAVAVDGDAEAESLVRELRVRGYGLEPDGVLEQEQTGRLATVRLLSPAGAGDPGVTVDLMFASSGIEREVVGAATDLAIVADRAEPIPIATRGHLIALKVLAGRAQDVADAVALIQAAEEADIRETREALHEISRRGYSRGKNLMVALENLIAASAGEKSTLS